MRLSIIIYFLVVTCIYCAQVRVSRIQQKGIQDLKSNRWGRTILNFVLLHSAVQGNQEDLTEAIQELIEDLSLNLESLDLQFKQTTNEFNSQVNSLQQDISDTEYSIGQGQDTIINLLNPHLEQIKRNMDQIKENIVFNKQSIDEETLVRAQGNKRYQAQLAEYSQDIVAVDDALTLIESLDDPSLVQVKKFKNAIEKISMKQWNNIKQGPMVHALIKLSLNQNFQDQGVLRQIIKALNEFRNDIVLVLNQSTTNEDQFQTDFELQIQQLKSELNEFKNQLNNYNIETTTAVSKRDEINNVLFTFEGDKQQFLKQLQMKQEIFAQETQIYTNFKNQYLQELAISEQAFTLIQNTEFGQMNVFL